MVTCSKTNYAKWHFVQIITEILTFDLNATDIFCAAPTVEWVLYFWSGGGGSLSQCVRLEQAQRWERRSSYWTCKTLQLCTVLWLFRWILIYIGLIRFGLVYRVSCLYWAITMPKEEGFYMYLHSCLNKPLDVIRCVQTHFTQYQPLSAALEWLKDGD